MPDEALALVAALHDAQNGLRLAELQPRVEVLHHVGRHEALVHLRRITPSDRRADRAAGKIDWEPITSTGEPALRITTVRYTSRPMRPEPSS